MQKKCPQCKNLISITAPTCLFCGRPNKFVTNNYVKKKWNKEYKKDRFSNFKILISKKISLLFIIIGILIILLISLSIQSNYKFNIASITYLVFVKRLFFLM